MPDWVWNTYNRVCEVLHQRRPNFWSHFFFFGIFLFTFYIFIIILLFLIYLVVIFLFIYHYFIISHLFFVYIAVMIMCFIIPCGISDGNPNVNSLAESEWTVVRFVLKIQFHVPLERHKYFISSNLLFIHDLVV